MGKHTPGPWFVEDDRVWALNEGGTNRTYIQVQGGYVSRETRERTSREEMAANARLIAAAPALLEALKDIATYAGRTIDAATVPLNGLRPGKVYSKGAADAYNLLGGKARAAIAKATGMTQTP